jgi:3-oxoacyl-[acyl-carrier protein] reductase
MPNRIDLSNRTAVVTGGAQGIGLAIAHRLVASGAKVILWDRDAALLQNAHQELSRHGPTAAVCIDQTDFAAVMAAASDGGAIDILVNNAGISGPTIPLIDYPIGEWRKIIDIDLNGPFYCCKAVAPGMIARGYGRIVNVASIAGKEGNPNAAAYSAAKAGVIALTKSLGKELASHNIAVNCSAKNWRATI